MKGAERSRTGRAVERRAALVAAVHGSPALLAAFRKGWGRNTVEGYLDEYRHLPDIVERLAQDLGVELPG